MKITNALRLAKWLYTACFALTALGLIAGLIDSTLSKVFYAATLLVLAAYIIVSAIYLHCPKCGHMIRVKPLVKQTMCEQCGHRFDLEDRSKNSDGISGC